MKTTFRFMLINIICVSCLHAQWVRQAPNITASLNAIFMLDNQEGWVVGDQGTLFHLTESGYVWAPESGLDPQFDYNDVWFVRSAIRTGWCVGERGRIYQRNTQGNWEPGNTNVISELLAISGAAGTRATDHYLWAVGQSGTILFSSNSGDSWNPQTGEAGTAFRHVEILSRLRGFITNNSGIILRTKDSGFNWNVVPTNTDKNLYGIHFANLDSGWAVGSDGTILITTNTGESWKPQDSPVSTRLRAIAAIDSKHLVAVGDLGTVLMSSNGGETWKVEIIQSDLNDHLLAVAVADTENYWIVGANGANFYSEGIVAFGESPIIENDRLEVGSLREITFITEFNSLVDIHHSIDADTAWIEIPAAQRIAASVGRFEWEVPNTPSATCLLRIRSSNKPRVAVISPVFRIRDPIAPTVDTDTSGIKAQKEQDLVLTATITDNNPTINWLFYRRGGETTYRQKRLDSIAVNTFRATIFAREGDDFIIDERGLEFYIQAIDTSPDSNSSTFATSEKPIYVPVQVANLQHGISSSNPGEDKYQLITIPYKLNDPSISSVLDDDLGVYDPHAWRLWYWRNDSAMYGEFTKADIGSFTQGRSFWLASVKDRFLSDAGQSYKPVTFNLVLHSGWNQIGHPFAFPVATQALFDANVDTTGISGFFGYDNGWQPTSVLEAGKGYFIKNMNSQPRSLVVPPLAASGAAAQLSKNFVPEDGWQLHLKVRAGRLMDDFNLIGMSNSAVTEWDDWDQPEPPPAAGKYLSLYFPHQEWEIFPDNYTTDFRPLMTEGGTWEFVVTTNVPGAVATIQFERIKEIPSGWQIYLLDDATGLWQDLRQNPIYSFPTANRTVHKKLRIAIGSPEFMESNDLASTRMPTGYQLDQNFPNPFNPTTAIRFGLPQPEVVSLVIFDPLGRTVKSLLSNEPMPAGYHVALWDGLNDNGWRVAGGIYYYRLSTQSYTQTIKMLYLR